MIKIKLLVDQLGLVKEKSVISFQVGSQLIHEFEINPNDFLSQANIDYKAGEYSALINSLTNSRRAILCQVDRILKCLGFNEKKLTTKKKIKILEDLGITVPHILQKVSQARNELEHDYKIPTLSQVEDSLDIATLFVEATERYIELFWGEFVIGNNDEYLSKKSIDTFKNQLEFCFNEEDKSFKVYGRIITSDEVYPNPKPIEKLNITPDDYIFPHVMRLALSEKKSNSTGVALDKFFDSLKATT